MSIASSRNRVRQNPWGWNNEFDNTNMSNSQSLNTDSRFQKSMDRTSLTQSLRGPATEIEIETEELEDLLENQPNFNVYPGARGFGTARVGGFRHVEGVLDGTDVAGNIGFAEGSMLHTDSHSFTTPHGNTNSVASHAQSQLMHNGFNHKVLSNGQFKGSSDVQRVLKTRILSHAAAPIGSVAM